MTTPKTPQQDIYDDYYFKHSCGGHEEFHLTLGDELAPWLNYVMGIADIKPNNTILDLGTGRGEIAYQSAMKDSRVIGLDYAFAALDLAKKLREKAQEKGKPFPLMLSDARNLPFPENTFDIIFMLDIVEHLAQDDLISVFRQVHHCLKPGGRLIIHTMPNLNYYKYGYPIFRFAMGLIGKKLPKDARKRFYHGEVHVNIQSPKSLRENLSTAGFDTIHVKLTQISGSWAKRFVCSIIPLKYIIANDIIAVAQKL
ncbi:MAG: methyltransferase domain-containing protein [Anaerolineaceae bacterium]|nr:methyltransferase domain-containing protein [Anaerolineaceae bacterium]